MTLKELIKKSGLRKEDLDKEILFSCDEEMNRLYSQAQIALLDKGSKLVLYPFGAPID